MGNIVCYSADGDILQYYTQWDVNQKLIIKGADTSSAPDFHFLNTLMSDTYVVESQISGGEIIVDVPDELLQYEVPIIAHVSYVDGTTEYTVRIPIMPRKKPVNYIYTETDSGSGSGGSSGAQVSIANNLTTNNANMALSAAQGVVIKKMIDDIDLEIESMIDLSEMTNAIRDAVKDKIDADQMNTAIEDALSNFDGDGSGGNVLVANNLTTDDPDMALSAAQGVVLDTKIMNVDRDVQSKVGADEMSSAINNAVSNKVSINEVNSAISEALSNFSGGGSGESGEDGATFTPSIDANGNLSWSNNKGLSNPETVNIKGDSGETPERGVHYWTETDISEIKSYLDDVIIGGRW